MHWSVIGSSASLAGYGVTEMGEDERILATNGCTKKYPRHIDQHRQWKAALRLLG
jgi:hypothetical protein